MKNLFRAFLFGALFGIAVGWWLSEEKQRREAQAKSAAFSSDPEVLAIQKERERMLQVDRWVDDAVGLTTPVYNG
jgi:hypothetical protein